MPSQAEECVRYVASCPLLGYSWYRGINEYKPWNKHYKDYSNLVNILA